MPTYDYLCEANGQVVEVSHKMSESIATWSELCSRVGIPLGPTAPAAPVRKLISGGFVNTGGGTASEPRPCETGLPCCGGVCGMN